MEREVQALLGLNYAAMQDKTQLENAIVQHKAIIANIIKQTHELNSIAEKQDSERAHPQSGNHPQPDAGDGPGERQQHKRTEGPAEPHHSSPPNCHPGAGGGKITHQKRYPVANEAIQAAHMAEVTELNKQWEELQGQLKALQPVQQQEQQYLSEIDDMRSQLLNNQYAHHDHMNKEEHKQTHQNAEVTTQAQVRLQEVKKNVHKVAKETVLGERLDNQQKNVKLKTTLITLQNQLATLRKSRNELMEKRKEAKISLSLNQEELEQYKAVGSLQKAKIKATKDKVDQMKALVAEQTAKGQKKIDQIRQEGISQLKNLRKTFEALQRSKQETKLRVERMKVLSQTILMQREEVEGFFIMALQSVRGQIERDKGLSKGESQGSKTYGDKVDIDELSPVDKQRILTNLYTKLALGP